MPFFIPPRVIARPFTAVAISQNYFDISVDSGEFGTSCKRLPRRFAPRNDKLFDKRKAALQRPQLVKKVLTDFSDKLLSKLQNRNKEDYFAILPAAAG